VFDKVIRIVDWCSDIWIVVSLAIMFFSIVLDVAFRQFLNAPLTWHLEVSQYMLINVTYIGAAVAHRHSQHISISIFVSKLSKRKTKYADLFGKAFMIPFLILLAYSCYDLLGQTRGLTPVLRLPMWTYYSPIFIGSVLLCFYSILALVNNFRSFFAVAEG